MSRVPQVVKTSVGLVLLVGVTLLFACAHCPPDGKTNPPASRELQLVLTKGA